MPVIIYMSMHLFHFSLKVFSEDHMSPAFLSDSPHWRVLKKAEMTSLKMYGESLKVLESLSVEIIHEVIDEMIEKGKEPIDLYPMLQDAIGAVISSLVRTIICKLW